MSFLGVEPGPNTQAPRWATVLGLGIADHRCEGGKRYVVVSYDSFKSSWHPWVRGEDSTQKAWEEIWPMVVRKRGGL